MPTETEPKTPDIETTDAPEIDPKLRDIVLRDMETQGKDAEMLDASEVEPISDAGLAMSAKSLVEMEMLLYSNNRVMAGAGEALEAAQANFNRISARMNFSTEAEFNARMLEYLPRLEVAEDEALTTMQHVADQCRAIIEATSFPREPQLSNDDLSRAASMREFVREDCETLTLAELQVKLQKAVASGDAVTAWLYTRYGTPRVAAPITESPYQNEAGETLYRVTGAMRAAQQQCQELIKHLGTRLSDSRVPKINAQAQEIIQKTRDFSREATARRSQAELQRMKASSSYNLL